MSKKLKSAIVAPITLKPFNKEADSTVHVVIETPKGCQNKYKFDPVLRSFRLNRVLPSGMAFPYDFGFVPSSQADDGDPADVLLLMDYPVFPGCVVESEQEAEGKKERNDRLVAVAKHSHSHSDLKDISDLNPKLLKQVGEFFINYHKQSGEKFKVLGVKGPKQGERLLNSTIKRAKSA